ncbi:MAG: aspartate carbamoyltransferase catalytic subunit [Pseudomonadota bacterium]
MTGPTGWDGILDTSETILWQGRPDGKVIFRLSNFVGFVFGLFFAGFALFWMVLASSAGGAFWMFGLIHFFAGLGVAFGAMFWSAWRRRHTWYTLTDRRAFIATDLPFRGRSLKSYPITRETVLEYDGADPATIHFNHEMRRGKNGQYRVDVGFERITDGAEVYRQMRDIQKRLAS